MSKEGNTEVFDSEVGPVTTVSERSCVKPLFGGTFWGALGGFLIYGAIHMFWNELPTIVDKEKSPDVPSLILIGIIFFIGYLMFTVLIRRIKAVRDKTLYFRAGAGGVSVCYPSGVKILSLLLSYKTDKRDVKWGDIKTWYPFKVKWNGIPMASQIKFEGESGGFAVNSRYFKGKRRTMTNALSAAQKKGEASLPPAQEPLTPEEGEQ